MTFHASFGIQRSLCRSTATVPRNGDVVVPRLPRRSMANLPFNGYFSARVLLSLICSLRLLCRSTAISPRSLSIANFAAIPRLPCRSFIGSFAANSLAHVNTCFQLLFSSILRAFLLRGLAHASSLARNFSAVGSLARMGHVVDECDRSYPPRARRCILIQYDPI